MERITSITNKVYKELLEISKGKVKEKILIEGNDLIEEALKMGKLIKVIVYDLDALDKLNLSKLEYIHLSKELFNILSGFSTPSKIIGIASLQLTNDNLGSKVLYLDNLQDPGNVGTLIRTALCFNYDAVVLSKDCVSMFSRKVIQASKGAIFKIKLAVKDLFELQDKYSLYSTTLDGEDEKNIDSLSNPFVLVLGNEGHGVRKEYQEISKKLKIEINSLDSLNVAVAGAIFMYRFN